MDDVNDYIIDIRRRLHQIPELAWEEEKTLALIKEEITKISPTCIIVEKKGGIWVDLTFDPSYERILFRADIDGLPIQEETGLPYASVHEGCMHACGHDMHAAMLLGAFKIVVEGKAEPAHNLRFVWQRAEENAWTGSGGEMLVQEGVCDGISHVYGLHIASTLKAGTFFSRPGYYLANASHLEIDIRCLGGHTMRPQAGSNAVDIITDIHVSLRGLPLRVLGPDEIVSFLPTISQTGTAANIMPNKASLYYTLRNFLTSEKRAQLIKAARHKVESVLAGYLDASLQTFTFHEGFPPLINPPDEYETVRDLLEKNGHATAKTEIIFAGEDFSYYLQKRPGAYWTLGAMQGKGWDHHTAKFNPDEKEMIKGVEFWVNLSMETALFPAAASRG